MMLRNRTTGKVIYNSLFNKTTQTEESKADFNLVLQEIVDRVKSEMPSEVSLPILAAFSKHKKEIAEIGEELARTPTPKESKEFANEEFLPFIMKQLVSAKLGLAGVVMAGLSNIPAVAALNETLSAVVKPIVNPIVETLSGYVISEGVPAGGSSTCPDATDWGCLQGYLSANGTVLTQFNRIVTQVVSKDADFASREQLRKCMTNEKVGKIVQSLFETGTSSARTAVSAQSAQWNGYQLSAQANSVPVDSAALFPGKFNAESQQCMSILGQAKQTAIIWGSIIGAVVLLAGCAFGYMKCRENVCPDLPDCCPESKSNRV